MTESELKQRTKGFALRVIRLVDALPKSIEGRALGAQLIRSGTSVGANYRAACRGRSKAEFIAKLGIVVEEADESSYWMELIIEAGLLPKDRVEPLLQEACELTAIMVASRISASKKQIANRKSQIGNLKSKIRIADANPGFFSSWRRAIFRSDMDLRF
ncbi:MAG: four helix bundle protein [Verrucomicrobia bacterium]|nr:four helix bundle protein [Verrucomicrobiota bacterium]